MAPLRPFRLTAVVALLTVGLVATASARTAGPPPVLAALPATGPVPRAAAVAAALAGPGASPAFGGRLVGEVVDAQTGQVLWATDPDRPEMVASTQKLLVAAAALDRLGPAHRPQTTLCTTGTVAGGVLSGSLYLRGGGDVLLATKASTALWPARTGLDVLASALAARGVRTVRGALVADGTAFTGERTAPGWKSTYVTEGSVAPVTALEVDRGTQPGTQTRVPDPDVVAGQDLLAALKARGITVDGGVRVGPTPTASTTLVAVSGPPVDAGIQEMLQDSDNDAAESYGRQLALATGRPATFAGAAAAITADLAAAGLPTAGTSLTDASGLSREDLVTPALLVAILRGAVATRPAWRPILAGLPVADFSGTLAARDGRTGDPAAGTVRAKTGNIAGVTSVAGTVVDAGGRQLVFMFVSDASQGTAQTEAALDGLAAALVPL